MYTLTKRKLVVEYVSFCFWWWYYQFRFINVWPIDIFGRRVCCFIVYPKVIGCCMKLGWFYWRMWLLARVMGQCKVF